MAQVRLTGPVEAELERRRTDSGRSLAAEADAYLRRALGLNPGEQSPTALAHKVPTPPATITAPTGQLGRAMRR